MVPVDLRNPSRSRSTIRPPWGTGTVTAGTWPAAPARRNRNGGGRVGTGRAGNRRQSITSPACQAIVRASRERPVDVHAHP